MCMQYIHPCPSNVYMSTHSVYTGLHTYICACARARTHTHTRTHFRHADSDPLLLWPQPLAGAPCVRLRSLGGCPPGDPLLPPCGHFPDSSTWEALVFPRFPSLSSVQFSRLAVSDSLGPHGLQHARPPCPSPTPRAHSNSCPSCR